MTCHSGPSAPRRLQVDSYLNLRKGSTRGPIAVPRDPQRRELVRRLRGTSLSRMPINGPASLSEEQTALIERWIVGGRRFGRR